MQIVWFYARRHKKLLFVSLVLAFLNQFFSLLDPQLMRILVDNYATNADSFARSEYLSGILLLLFGIIFVALLSRTAKAFQDYVVNVVTETIGTDLYADGVEHVFALPYAVFEDERSGSVLLNLQKARDETKQFIASLINVVFLSLVGMIFVIGYAFVVHWAIAIAFLALIPVVATTTLVLSKKIKDAQTSIIAQSADLAGSTTETLRNVGLVKALGLENQEVKRLNGINKHILELELKKVKLLRTLTYVQGTLVNLVRVIVLFITLALIWYGKLTIGEFTIFIFYTFYVFNPLYNLADVVARYQQARAAGLELERILSLPKSDYEPGDIEIDRIEKISFESVSHMYSGARETSVRDISFDIETGQTIALAGPSGSGKSTITRLLVGLYKPQQGMLKINDTPAQRIDFSSFRSKIGFVAQETQLFSGTIRENLLFAQPKATDEDLKRVLKMAAVDSLLERGNRHTGIGLDARIGETGIKLSGGERQRLAIARALLRDPDLLIFDEATSALDSLTEAEITKTIKHIRELHPHLMMVLVAHRLSTISHADTILVMKGGEIRERGTHAELLNDDGLYRAMWREQMA